MAQLYRQTDLDNFQIKSIYCGRRLLLGIGGDKSHNVHFGADGAGGNLSMSLSMYRAD